MGKFRKGDVVFVEATVDSDLLGDGDLRLCIPGNGGIYVGADRLTMRAPKIEVGDLVRCPDRGTSPGEVLAVANDHAWVEIGAGEYATWWLPKVVRLDPETSEKEATVE